MRATEVDGDDVVMGSPRRNWQEGPSYRRHLVVIFTPRHASGSIKETAALIMGQ